MKLPKNLSENEIQSLLNSSLDKVSETVVKKSKENSLLSKTKSLVMGVLALSFLGTIFSALSAIFVKVFYLVYNLIP